MEELLERLVIAVEQQNSAFPWDSVISILALIASWVTIFFSLNVGVHCFEKCWHCSIGS